MSALPLRKEQLIDHDISEKEKIIQTNLKGIKKVHHLKLVHNDNTEMCGCRCIGHCSCDCDRKTF